MGQKLFVGGLPWSADEQALERAFDGFGTLVQTSVVRDRETNRSRGFGFVTFSTEEEAQAAVAAMDGAELDGRRLRVSLAQERGGGRGPRREGPGRRDHHRGPPSAPIVERRGAPGGRPQRSRPDFDRSGPPPERRGPRPPMRSGGGGGFPPAGPPGGEDWAEDRQRRRKDRAPKKRKDQGPRRRGFDDDYGDW